MDIILAKAILLAKLQTFIDANKHSEQLVAFYLFGSYASGQPTPMSDIDLAVLFDKSVPAGQFLSERLRLMGYLSSALGNDEFELVVLNEVPAGLAYRIIRDGELCYVRDEAKGQLVDFKVRTMDKYFDFQPVQRMFSEGLARRLREGDFGGGQR